MVLESEVLVLVLVFGTQVLVLVLGEKSLLTSLLVYIVVNQKFTSRWNRRTLPPKPYRRCKTAKYSLFRRL